MTDPIEISTDSIEIILDNQELAEAIDQAHRHVIQTPPGPCSTSAQEHLERLREIQLIRARTASS